MAERNRLICDRCHAGMMEPYEKTLGRDAKVTIRGTKCTRCGFVLLENDDDIWSATAP